MYVRIINVQTGNHNPYISRAISNRRLWRSKCTKIKARTTLMSAIYFSCIYSYPHYFSIKKSVRKFCAKCEQRATPRLGAQCIFSAQSKQRATFLGRAIPKAAQLLKARKIDSCIKMYYHILIQVNNIPTILWKTRVGHCSGLEQNILTGTSRFKGSTRRCHLSFVLL